ncbi:MAG: TolC family protein [Bacteroidales bacterium]|nr:TolC family protein [Bacteroidales bacterium]MCF8389264.1 TolC family protein [Bacteroidales bacterium]
MRTKIYTFIFILIGSTTSLFSQEKLLSLSDAIDYTLANNYGIVISSLEENSAGLNNTWGNAGRLPSVGFDLNSQNNIRYVDGSGTTNNNLIADLNVGWKIFDGFRVNITKEKLDLLEDLSQGQSAVVIENTIQNLMLAYYYVLLQEENLKVIEELLTLSKDRYDYELARYDMGNAISVNVLLAKNVWLNDKAACLKQEYAVKDAYRTLNFIMAEKDNPQWLLISDFAADTSGYELSSLMEKMISSNYVLKNQYINQSLKEKERKLKESDLLPDFSISAGINNTLSRSEVSGNNASNTNTYSPYGNLSFSYDIFTGGIRKTAVSVAKINAEISEVRTGEMIHSLQNEMLGLYDNHLLRMELLSLANENLETAELNLNISEQKYKNGSLTSFEYREIQLIHLNASLSRLVAIYDLIYSETEMTRLTGGFLNSVGE